MERRGYDMAFYKILPAVRGLVLVTAIATGLVPHAPFRSTRAPDGTIYLVNGTDRALAWDGLAATSRNMGIDAPTSIPTTALNGAGVLTGTYYYYVAFLNSLTGEYSGLSPLSAALTAAANTIRVTKVSTTTDTQVDKWRVFRNTNGETDTFYFVTDVPIGTAFVDDNNSDITVGAAAVMQDRTRIDSKYPFIASCKGRTLGYGSRIETVGTIATTSGGPGIVGTGTYFRQSHVGQRIRIGSEAVYYTILSVTNSTNATLATNYVGTSAGGKTFRIYPVRMSDICWSSPSSSEGFAIADSAGVFPNDGDVPTGLHVINSAVVPFKLAHAYRFTYDGADPNPLTGTGQISLALSNRGLIRHECCAVVGTTGYCLDTQGVYAFDGATQAVPIDQAIRRYFQPDTGISTAETVNRAYGATTWHGIPEPKSNSVWWFLTTGSDTKPKTAIAYEIERQRWLTHSFPMALTASCLERDANGEVRAWVGDENGCLWCLAGIRGLEGAASSGTLSGSPTAATASTLTDGSAAFQTTNGGLVGVPVTIISGTGSGQVRIIQSNTATALTLSTNWATNPDTTSVYRVGYIDSRFRHVWMTLDRSKQLDARRIMAYYDPTTDERNFEVRFFKDFGATPITEWVAIGDNFCGLEIPVTAWDSTKGWLKVHTINTSESGRVEINLQQNVNAAISIEFRMLDSNKPVIVKGYDLMGFVQAVAESQRVPT